MNFTRGTLIAFNNFIEALCDELPAGVKVRVLLSDTPEGFGSYVGELRSVTAKFEDVDNPDKR